MKNILYRTIVLDTCGAAIVAWLWMLGYVDRVVGADAAHMVPIIAGVFLLGKASAYVRAYKVDTAVDTFDGLRVHERSKAARSARKLAIKNLHIADVVAVLFVLGIIGNAIGCLNAFGSFDVAALGTPDGIRDVGGKLLAGVGTSFGSTLVGCALAVWTMAGYRMLDTATMLYIEDVS